MASISVREAPATSARAEIARVPPPLTAKMILTGESWIWRTSSGILVFMAGGVWDGGVWDGLADGELRIPTVYRQASRRPSPEDDFEGDIPPTVGVAMGTILVPGHGIRTLHGRCMALGLTLSVRSTERSRKNFLAFREKSQDINPSGETHYRPAQPGRCRWKLA